MKKNILKCIRNITSTHIPLIRNRNAKIPTTAESSIDELITKRTALKNYSRSLIVEPYVPLTKKEKVSIIENIDESTSTRFKKYSNIFEQIKQQINDINTSLLLSNNNEANTNRKPQLDCEDYIEEKDEENLLSPKLSKKQKGFAPEEFRLSLNNLDDDKDSSSASWASDYVDFDDVNPETLRENTCVSRINLSPEFKSINKTKCARRYNDICKTTACSTGGNNSMIVVSKNEKSFNQKEFYYEPRLNENEKDTTTVTVKYCNCLIF